MINAGRRRRRQGGALSPAVRDAVTLAAVAALATTGLTWSGSGTLVGGLGATAPITAVRSMAGKALNAPVVGMTTTADGGGYWLLGADGGVFSFGDAVFHGSTGDLRLTKPVVGMASTPDGGGYWLVASDGGVFSFGDAVFHGSTGGLRLTKPVVGMASTPDGGGYWMVASDGGVFSFGDAVFHGSGGGAPQTAPIVGMSAGGGGYRLLASDGGVLSFGAPFEGSAAGTASSANPAVGMASLGVSGYDVSLADGTVVQLGAQPPPAAPPPPLPVTVPPAPGGPARSPAAWPFASSSPWNTPIGTGAMFSSASDPATVELTAGGGSLNARAWSVPVVQASSTDPYQTVQTAGTNITYQIPDGAAPAVGADAHLDVIDPSHTYVDECWEMRYAGVRTWTCGYHVRSSLTGSGFATGGVRANGSSSLGGLIRASELQQLTIPHALAVALGANQLRTGWIWPASAQDSNAASSYTGLIPMGSLVAIPSTVDLAGLGLSPPGLAVARALQRYGGYVADRAGGPTLYAEPSADAAAADAVQADMARIVAMLRIVGGNSPTTVGGGGTPAAPLAPPLG